MSRRKTNERHTVPITIKMSKVLLDRVDACVDKLNAKPDALAHVTRSDVMRSAIASGLRHQFRDDDS
jgi:hypothetical protein